MQGQFRNGGKKIQPEIIFVAIIKNYIVTHIPPQVFISPCSEVLDRRTACKERYKLGVINAQFYTRSTTQTENAINV